VVTDAQRNELAEIVEQIVETLDLPWPTRTDEIQYLGVVSRYAYSLYVMADALASEPRTSVLTSEARELLRSRLLALAERVALGDRMALLEAGATAHDLIEYLRPLLA
jgi:hypothetical protein